MTVSSKLSIVVAAVFVATSLGFSAPIKSGKVRSVIGEVTYQKKAKGNWSPLRVGGKIQEKDLIRTEVESQAVIALPDGSIISIEENSLVEFSILVSEDGVQSAVTDVKQGKVRFDAQKQKDGGKFLFKTGTATAAIRGTDGTFGRTNKGALIGSLNTGLMDLEENGQKISIKEKQFAVIRAGKAPLVGEAKNAGNPEFINSIETVLDDPTKSDDEILKSVKTADEGFEKTIANLQQKYSCTLKDVPESIDTNSVVITVSCSQGVSLEIGGEKQTSTGADLDFKLNWAGKNYGEKKFTMNCSAENKNFECGRFKIDYTLPDPNKKKEPYEDLTQDPEEQLKKFETPSAMINSFDSKRCKLSYSTKAVKENEGTLSFLKKNEVLKVLKVNSNTTGSFDLKPGFHTYTLQMDDTQGNTQSVSKDIGCYPSTPVALDIKGGAYELFRLPPPPRGEDGDLHKTLRFKIKNVTQNDPAHIRSILVKQGSETLLNLSKSAISDLDYDLPIDIPRGKKTNISITVTMMNGKVVKGSKIYEVP